MASDPGKFVINAMLADSAVSSEGKLYMQGGGWNAVNAAGFPFVQSRTALVIVIDVPWTQTNRNHRMDIELHFEGHQELIPLARQLSIEDGQAKEVRKIGAQFNIGRPPQLAHGDSQPVPFAVNIDQLMFESPGLYSFVIFINEIEEARLSFRVNPPPNVLSAG